MRNFRYNGDCFAFIKTLPENSIDLILTDPPYGINYQDNIRTSQYWKKEKPQTESKRELIIDKIQNDFRGALDWQEFLSECYRVLKPHKMIYLFCRKDVAMDWGPKIRESRLRYAHDFIWIKGDMGYGNLSIMGMVHETIIGLSKGTPEKSRELIINGVSKKRIPACYCGKVSPKEYYGHPTQKPIGLLSLIILNRTSPGDVVFDPFSGVASTELAAKLNQRGFLGCELNPEVYRRGEARLMDKVHQLKIGNINSYSLREYRAITSKQE